MSSSSNSRGARRNGNDELANYRQTAQSLLSISRLRSIEEAAKRWLKFDGIAAAVASLAALVVAHRYGVAGDVLAGVIEVASLVSTGWHAVYNSHERRDAQRSIKRETDKLVTQLEFPMERAMALPSQTSTQIEELADEFDCRKELSEKMLRKAQSRHDTDKLYQEVLRLEEEALESKEKSAALRSVAYWRHEERDASRWLTVNKVLAGAATIASALVAHRYGTTGDVLGGLIEIPSLGFTGYASFFLRQQRRGSQRSLTQLTRRLVSVHNFDRLEAGALRSQSPSDIQLRANEFEHDSKLQQAACEEGRSRVRETERTRTLEERRRESARVEAEAATRKADADAKSAQQAEEAKQQARLLKRQRMTNSPDPVQRARALLNFVDEPPATEREVKRMARRLLTANHPDMGASPDGAASRIAQIQNAKTVLLGQLPPEQTQDR